MQPKDALPIKVYSSTAGAAGAAGAICSTASAGSGSANHRDVSSGDAGVISSGSSLSSVPNGPGSSALSNAALHSGADVCSEVARINDTLSEDALSHVDHDTVMDDSELLEFDFHSEIQPLGANKLSLTMPEDSTLASNAGSLKRQLIMTKENYQLLCYIKYPVKVSHYQSGSILRISCVNHANHDLQSIVE
ncbi:hypothetical protein MUCCIDRAFT_114368 [Mucor lusitanicus CBS 277.49]|uniref:Uncharacterized protein n=1 Tax=Mucor lusitanicus CBS 277.49 TaxID=747725 RepID=A0A162Q5L0_MUCCL|nr:hypothetical protein MUCCIDRAFT_114368 [Mucor lusitanicus CBS 277.49]